MRNGYATVLSARTILDDGPVRSVLGAYLFVPALALTSVLATALGRRGIGLALALLSALAGLVLILGVSVTTLALPAGIVGGAIASIATVLAVMAVPAAQVARRGDSGDAGGR